MRKGIPTLTDVISQLEEYQRAKIEAIEHPVDELLAILRWNNTPEGRAQDQRAQSLKAVMEYIDVLGPRDSEAARLLVLKAARIRYNADLVEAWLASVNNTGGGRGR